MEVEEAPEGMESFRLPEEDLQDRGDTDGHSTGLEEAASPAERDQVAGGGGAGGWAGADRAPSSRGGSGGPGGRARGPGSAGAAPSAPRLSCSLCERLFGSPEHLREHEYRHALSLMAVSPDWPDTQGAPPGPPGPPGHQLPATLPQRPPLLLLHHHHHLLHRRRQRHHLQGLCLPAATTPASARYFCAQCPASFTLKSNADRHQKTIHLKRKLMQCAFCLKHFRDRTDLHRHLSSVHSKERGHACPACTKAFSTHKNLATHVKLCCQAPLLPGPCLEPGWY